MLFNSFPFLLFLPVVLAGYYLLIHRVNRLYTAAWLLVASVFFYASWGPSNLVILVASTVINYAFGRVISRSDSPRLMLTLGLSFNLLLLGYYKYAGLLSATANQLLHVQIFSQNIALPVGISFFTFTQIAYLVDVYRRAAYEPNFIYYGLFVTYFPHLVAGPILHHAEMIPQFKRKTTEHLHLENVAVGFCIFLVGLAKKLLLADSVAPYAAVVFDGGNTHLTWLEAWGGALCYTMQIYFDFSGYSDMAIGISKMFGIRLPLNFNSPYKAASIIDFWRRWHMTLSRFLRDYLYIPLGGNRKGGLRRYANLLCTMLLGGLWHGAGWTFAFWGFLHGIYLVINHVWRFVFDASRLKGLAGNAYRYLSCCLTFLCVILAWVFFRSPDFDRAWAILMDMFGQGDSLPVVFNQLFAPARFILLLGIALLLPNTQQIFQNFHPSLGAESVAPVGSGWTVRLNYKWGLVFGFLAFLAWQEMMRAEPSPFLYFRF